MMEDPKKPTDSAYEFVQAISPYEYQYKKQTVSILQGEIFLLLKRTSEDWWQVIRKGEKRPFYAPREYLELTSVEPSTMKNSLRRKMAHQRHLQNQQRLMQESQGSLISPLRAENSVEQSCHDSAFESQECPHSESLLSIAEDSDGNTSFEFDSNSEPHHKAKIKHRSASTDSQPDSSSSYGPTDLSNLSIQSQSSSSKDILSSSHTSASSLTDDPNSKSDESFSYFVLESPSVTKAASTDGLRGPKKVTSPSKGMQPKATSNEELDNPKRKKDLTFQSNLLSLRKRSNSVDMKECDTNLTLIETEKITSLEKKKSRLTKDPMNRRRSWAMNDTACMSTFQPTMNSIPPSSIAEKYPPKLPPKVKNRINRLSLSIDNLKKLDVMETRIEPQPDARSQNTNSSENPKIFTKKAPVALPRRTVPVRDNHSLPKKLVEVVESPVTEVKSMDRAIKRNKFPENGCYHHRSSSLGPNTGDVDVNMELPRKVEPTKEFYEKEGTAKFREVSHKVMDLQRKAPGKGRRVEELIEELENKSKSSKQCDISKLVQQSPPSPTDSPMVTLFDDWGKYLEKESRMPFYYNNSTKEKRWKPPRRSVPQPQTKPLLDTSVSPVPSPKLSPRVPEDPRRATITKSSKDASSQRYPLTKPKPPVVHMLSANSYGRSRTDSYGSPSTVPRNPGNYALDTSRSAHAIVGCDTKVDSNKSQWSLLSSISNSFSFIKSNGSGTSHVISKSNISVPTNLLSPSEHDREGSISNPSTVQSQSQLKSMQTVLEQFQTPKGWVRKYDALSQQIYFQNVLTGEKWNPATDCSATLYFYPVNGGSSKWILPDYHAALDSLPDNGRSVTHGNLERERARIAKEEFVSWCLHSKEGKKVRKNWTSAYVKYLPDGGKTARGTPYGILIFSKSPEEQKKLETFPMVCPCFMLEDNGGTTSRDNVLALKNADSSIVLIQTKDNASHALWKEVFQQNKIREIPHTPDKERKAKKVAEKPLRRDSAEESVNNNNEKGLKDILLSFLKRRPMQETLVHKGIYKETVFGSTISELCSKDATYIPLFVLKCINAIERKAENFKIEGLYRIPGNAPRIQKIRFEIAQNRYTILEEEKDVHNLTGSLKLFFRELKEPLIPFRNYQAMIQSTGSEFLKGRTRSEALKDALKKLPRCNYDTLKILLEHLLKINMYEKLNRMSLMNLAIVFGPCLLWPESTVGFDLMTGVMLQNRVVEALLSDYKAIYKD